MRFGNYSVLIPEGSERGEGYVALSHGRQYAVQLGNHSSRRCQAEVSLDGKSIGTFVLSGYGTARLERAPHDNGRFTFYADDTTEAEAAGLATISQPDRGLVQVKFTPEKSRYRHEDVIRLSSFSTESSVMRGAGGQSQGSWASNREEKTSGGITGLSGHSDQQFTTVAGLNLDESGSITITLRLMAGTDGPHPLTATSRGNPVPPPV